MGKHNRNYLFLSYGNLQKKLPIREVEYGRKASQQLMETLKSSRKGKQTNSRGNPAAMTF